MYRKVISALIVAVFFCLAGCSVQETGEDISYAADTAIVEEEKSKKKETSSACIKDEDGLLDDEQTQLFYNFALCYANTLKEIQPTDGIIRLAHISIHIRALYI